MSWWQTALPLGIALLTVLLPGAIIGRCWGIRGLRLAACAGPLTVSVTALVAILAPYVNLPLTPLLVGVAALSTAVIGLIVRAIILAIQTKPTSMTPAVRGGAHPVPSARRPRDYPLLGNPRVTTLIITAVSLALPAVLIGLRYVRGIGRPENFSQTYDNIFHLNAVKTIQLTGDGSSLTLGGLTPASSAFYPAAWHDLVALVMQTASVDVPLAINLTNIVIGAIIWPLCCLYLVSRITGGRLLPMMLTGVLCAAFNAFPYLMIDFGVLYPNHLAIAILPLAIALFIDVLGIGSPPLESPMASAVLLAAVLPGIALAHPSAVVAFVGLSLPLVFAKFAQQIIRASRGSVPRRAPIIWGVLVVLYSGFTLLVWTYVRPGPETALWEPFLTASQAVGEVITAGPMKSQPSWIILVLVAFGLYVMLRERRQWWVFGMFLIGAGLYIIAVSMAFGPLRTFFVGVWYNDNFRLAALLPVVTLPIVVLGAEFLIRRIVDMTRGLIQRRRSGRDVERPGLIYGSMTLVLILAVAALSQNISLDEREASLVHQYALTPHSELLTTSEEKLIERVSEHVPEDEKVIGNPAMGSSLVLALGDRWALTPHVTGHRTTDELTLIDHWDEAAFNTTVCPAVRATNTWWALDLRHHEVAPRPPFRGLNSVDDAPGLRLVDQEGDAKLYEITVCRD